MSNNENNQKIVRQMKVSPLLTRFLSESLLSAKSSHHQFFTPEHLLFVALKDDFVVGLLTESGGDYKILRENLFNYIETKIPVISDNSDSALIKAPVESVGFQAVMNRAAFYSISFNSDILDITDVLVSMFDETKNYCSYYLRSSGVNRSRLLDIISKNRTVSNKENNSSNSSSENQENQFPFPEGMMSNNKDCVKRFTVNLTEMARNGELDELIGRDEELERTIQILCRRSKNNPLHVGDAGVGKTAITYGLAQRIVQNKVPALLKDYTIYSLDIGLMIAGAKFRGDFEERIHGIIKELTEKKNVILFIDEIHMLMGAGTNGNTQMDAANLLKPVLASGKIKFIGSTTFDEYSKIFEKDRALSRRFQKIDIIEPSISESVKILTGLQKKYESYHNVKYTTSAIQTAVDLSVQYLPDRRLPDKAIDIIDEAGALLNINQNGGFLGNSIKQNGKSSIPQVTVGTIQKVTAKIAKLPIDSVSVSEKNKLKEINSLLSNDIFGQEQAVDLLSKSVKKARAGFRNPDKPEACYLFVGPTGCGKTELAKSLSKILNEPLLRYDMSEYQEKHSVSRLVGSPPGYVGFEEGGQLAKEVRKNPHAVILFDEIEKAHQDIYNVLLQIMDYGTLTDNQGRKSDFRSCIIIMTSNAGAREMERSSIGFGSVINDDNKSTLKEAVEKEFSPEFRNRLDAIIPFNYLDKNVAKLVCKKEINKLAERLKKQKVDLFVTDNCIDYLTELGYSKEFGARNMTRVIEDKIANQLVDEVLFGKLEKGGKVTATLKDADIIFEIN